MNGQGFQWHRRPQFWIIAVALFALGGLVAAGTLPSLAGSGSNAEHQKRLEELADRGASYANTLSTAFREASGKVLPSVVMITTQPKVVEHTPAQKGPAPEHRFGGSPANPFEGTPFGDLFRDQPEMRRFFEHDFPSTPSVPRHGVAGMGSGVIIDSGGIILTNNHVVDGAGTVTVRLHDGREFTASDVIRDPKTDLAVVRIKGAKDLQAARLGDSDKTQVGDWVLALGQPFGLEGTVTAGIISAKGRGLGIADRENFLQTDAPINPGNSGGPLVNLDGEVVGINTAISSRSGGNQGIGFAVPVNLAKWVSRQLIADGKVRRAYLGVAIQQVNQQLADQFGVDVHQGVVVTEVYPDTPAAKAGLVAGDVIVQFEGKPVTTPNGLQGLVEQSRIGGRQDLVVFRDGKRKTLDVSVEEQPSQYGLASFRSGGDEGGTPGTTSFEKLGIEVEPLEADVAEQLGVDADHGLVITAVTDGSPAELAGLGPGNVIVEVNRKAVHSVEGFRAALKDRPPEQGVLLLVRTTGGSRYVVLKATS